MFVKCFVDEGVDFNSYGCYTCIYRFMKPGVLFIGTLLALSLTNQEASVTADNILISILKLIESGSSSSSSSGIVKESWIKSPLVLGLNPVLIKSTVYFILSRFPLASLPWPLLNDRDRGLAGIIWVDRGCAFAFPSTDTGSPCDD